MHGTLIERGKRCRFKLADIICPDRRQALMQITADLEVTGEIVFLSNQGSEPDQFVIVEVEGILSPLVVSTHRLHPIVEAGASRTRD